MLTVGKDTSVNTAKASPPRQIPSEGLKNGQNPIFVPRNRNIPFTMKKILLLSDTHGTMDQAILRHARWADQIWHAGDIGSMEVADRLAEIAPLRAVYGNIDGGEIRAAFPERLRFVEEGVEVLIKHIGGYPGHYDPSVRDELFAAPPALFVSGHSHILKVMMDRRSHCMHFNPGAAGRFGFHKVRTLLRFTLEDGRIDHLEAVELGPRTGGGIAPF